MTDVALSSVPIGAAGGKDAWVHLVPGGTFSGEDGRGPYTVDPAAVVAASGTRPKVIDFAHATHHGAAQGLAAPAAGWVTKLEARADGVWGWVEWTPGGRRALKDKEYRFISPVFGHDQVNGTVSTFHAAALTNAPNLTQLPALHSAVKDPPEGAPPKLEELLRQQRAEGGAEVADVFAACGLPVPNVKEAD